MASYDSHTLVGHVGKLDELKYSQDGTAIKSFSLAVNSGKRDDPPTWYRISCFRATAENVQQYVKVGDPLLVAGDRLKVSEWTADDGSKRFTLELTAQRVVFLKARGEGDSEESSGSTEALPF